MLTALSILSLFLLGCKKEKAPNQSLAEPKKDRSLSVEFLSLKSMAENGDVKAQYNLGMKYYHGQEVAQDDNEAMKWYLKAAKKGYAKAQYHLGTMYADGLGTMKDSKKAVKWYLAAAGQGDALSQYDLGMMFFDGNGIERNYVTAYAWWHIASYNGNEYAKNAKETHFVKLKGKFSPDKVAEAHLLSKELLRKYPLAEHFAALKKPTFDMDILPILKQRCTECHGKDNQKGKLRMDSFAEFIMGADGKAIFIAEKPGESEIYRRLTLPEYDDESMPREGNRVPEPVAKVIMRWIKQGAKQ